MSVISSRSRRGIPPPDRLCELLRSLAMLDAIVEPRWAHRYYSYDPNWAPGEVTGSMRDRQGDWCAVLFPAAGGAVMRGFGHDREMSPFRGRRGTPWTGLFDGLPDRYDWVRDASGVVTDEVTFCLWYDDDWQIGAVDFPEGSDDPDGSEDLLMRIPRDPSSYARWACDYYERELDPAAVEAIYATTPLTAELVEAPSAETSMRTASHSAREIGYPMAKAKKKKAAKSKKTPAKKRPLSAKRREAVARMKAARGFGEASFRVELKKRTIRMLVHDKVVVEVETTDEGLYERLFELVQSTISEAKN